MTAHLHFGIGSELALGSVHADQNMKQSVYRVDARGEWTDL